LSWFSNLAKTYDNVADIVGVPNADGVALLPPEHMVAKTDICVVIDDEGNFRDARAAKEDVLNIIAPCTEDSASRTSAAVPHPLHDQIGYLASNEKKRAAYLAQIAKWSIFHPKVEAVYKYVLNNSLIQDLQALEIKVDDKLFIRFSVEIQGDNKPNLWQDSSVADAWQQYCEQQQSEEEALCYVTGSKDIIRTKHPKGVNPSVNGAKLISCNDESNYTYRGRFTKAWQANAIGNKASHKAHAMLKYLIATQGYKCDSQAIVAWALDDAKVLPEMFENSLDLYGHTVKTERDELIEAQGNLEQNYAKQLSAALRGMGRAERLKDTSKHVAVIATDAATTGRMGITFYQDLLENEYIERIVNWHETCCWHFSSKGKNYVSAPSVDRIIAAVYGEPKGEGYLKIKKQARERMLHFIINGEQFDRTWLNATVNRVSNPFSYDKQDGGWDMHKWAAMLNVACAIVRKYYFDRKEGFTLELDKMCDDRSYLYGRLLGFADKIESLARWVQNGKDDTDKRPTNAVRYMSAFAAKPFRTWKLIVDQLNPYIQKLQSRGWYQLQMDEIKSLFKNIDEYASDKPLDGKYLMGYSLQRREFIKDNKDSEETKNV
jgi:CRISPR-associated protein Csd1